MRAEADPESGFEPHGFSNPRSSSGGTKLAQHSRVASQCTRLCSKGAKILMLRVLSSPGMILIPHFC